MVCAAAKIIAIQTLLKKWWWRSGFCVSYTYKCHVLSMIPASLWHLRFDVLRLIHGVPRQHPCASNTDNLQYLGAELFGPRKYRSQGRWYFVDTAAILLYGHVFGPTVMNNQVQSLTRPTNPNAHHVNLLRSKLFQQPCKSFPCYRTRCYKACVHRPRYSHRNRN